MPLVSVITPTYNRAYYLKQAIESVYAQTFTDWEMLVVDDGSGDETKALVSRYSEKDSRIHYLHQKNSGCATARNTGLKNAKGKYVAFLDDDDRWLPEKLGTQVAFMESHPEIGLCYTRFRVYRKVGDRLEEGKLFPPFLITKFEQLSDAFIPPSAQMIKKSCLDQLGGFDVRYHISEDFDLLLRFAQRWSIAPIDRVLVTTVMDGRNHTAQSEIKISLETSEILRNLELVPEYSNRKRLIRAWIALRFYLAAREYLDQKNHWQAVIYFARALLTDPLVGLAVRRQGEEGSKLIVRILIAYAAVPVCLLKGIFHREKSVN